MVKVSATSQWPATASLNRQQRRANAAQVRRRAYDFETQAEVMGLPIEIVEKMPANLRNDIAAELCHPNTAPALARRDHPVRVAEWINSYTESWFRLPGATEQIACRAGCAHCCMIVPVVSDGETTMLRAAIARLPEPAQQQIAADMVVAAEAVRAAGGAEAAWPLRCPLLGEDNRCQVYADRPSACRAWASKDAARCASCTSLYDTVPIPFVTAVARAAISFLRDIFNLQVRPLPLALERNAR